MSETIENTNEKRKRYVAQVSFSIPDSGPVGVFARDEAHARELFGKLLAHVKDLVIHDIVEEANIQQLPPAPNAQDEQGPPPGATVN